MPPKPQNLIVPYAGPSFPLTLITQQGFKRFTAFELRMDDLTVIRRIIFFDDVLRCWVEGISRRGPDVDLVPIVTRIPGAYVNRITVAPINPETFDAWLRQVPPTVRAACSGHLSVAVVVETKHDVGTPFSCQECSQIAPAKKRVRRSRVRRVDGKSVRVGEYPSDAITPPSSDSESGLPPAKVKPAEKSISRARSRARSPNSNEVDELRAAIDYLETRLEVVEHRSTKSKKKVNAVCDALSRKGILSPDA